MRSLSTLLVASLLSLGACVVTPGPGPGPGPARPIGAAPEPEPRAGQLFGVISDARTHQPIGRAAVDLSGPQITGAITATTVENGRFETRGVPPGDYGIRVRRKGYQEMIKEHFELRGGKTELNIDMIPQ